MPRHSSVHKITCSGLLYAATLVGLSACHLGPIDPACNQELEASSLDEEEQSFLQLLNQYRTANGLGTVDECASLSRGAQAYSEDMGKNGHFSHDGLDGSQPWDRACDACYTLGCGPRTGMGEILARGHVNAEPTMDQWRTSHQHNKLMLTGSFKVAGVGRALDDVYGAYWTVLFGEEAEPSCH
jgi:uncharacterized protein YkwD